LRKRFAAAAARVGLSAQPSSASLAKKFYLNAYSTEHAKDLGPIEEVQINPDNGFNLLNSNGFLSNATTTVATV
jgi:hypothetical protein